MESAMDLNDLTLDELRPLLAAALPADAAFDGWTPRALETTAQRLGVNPAIALLAFDGDAGDMIAAWFEAVDAEMLNLLPTAALSVMKVRQRITALVEARLSIMAPQREALRRAQAILAQPQNLRRAARLGWRAADVMWRAAGDSATDYNHFTKRAILGSVYASTMLVFVNDESENWSETRAFLSRRIDGIMQFEKTKAKFTKGPTIGFSPARLLGRLRYPSL
jgi:ubiquinone biosynthesis protein COQ9